MPLAGVPAARGRHQLQAADPQDDGVLPRRPAELRGGRHAQPARVRPGLLREAGRRRGRLQAHRPPLQDAGLRARRVPRRARGDPPPPAHHRHLLAAADAGGVLLRAALRPRWTSACTAHNHGVPAAEVGAGARADGRAGRARLPGHRAEAPDDRLPAPGAAARRARARGRRLHVRHRRHRRAARRARAAVARATSRAMVGALRHRGPDEFGVYRDARAGLGHARLSIIDLATGQQPLSNEDGTLWIVFNGEIFNYVELRAELEALGHRFRTPQRHRGHRPRLRGVGRGRPSSASTASGPSRCGTPRRRTLVLARDRLGVRPLYLCEHGGRLCFASEVKAIFAADPAIPRALRPGRPRPRSSPSGRSVPPQTVFAGRAPSSSRATCASYARRACRDRRLLDARATPTARGRRFRGIARRRGRGACATALEQADAAAHAARRRAGRQLPVGRPRQLAGRRARAAGRRASGSAPSRCASRTPSTTRRRYQRADGRALIGSDHHEVVVSTPRHRRASSPTWSATPSARSCAPRRRRCSCSRGWCARPGIKVVLTGEGADEMFAGYDLFREAQGPPLLGAPARPRRCRPRLLERLYPYLARSPVAQRAMARRVLRPGPGALARAGLRPPDRAGSRTAALQRLLSADAARRPSSGPTSVARAAGRRCPPEFARWSSAGAGPVPRGAHAAVGLPARPRRATGC